MWAKLEVMVSEKIGKSEIMYRQRVPKTQERKNRRKCIKCSDFLSKVSKFYQASGMGGFPHRTANLCYFCLFYIEMSNEVRIKSENIAVFFLIFTRLYVPETILNKFRKYVK